MGGSISPFDFNYSALKKLNRYLQYPKKIQLKIKVPIIMYKSNKLINAGCDAVVQS